MLKTILYIAIFTAVFATGYYFSTLRLLQTSDQSSERISFCQLGNDPDSWGGLTIDMNMEKVLTYDTSSQIRLINDTNMIGFEAPFPLVIPVQDDTDSTWSSERYHYKSRRTADGKWFLVEVIPRANDSVLMNSEILYSKNEGVVAVKVWKADNDDFGFELYRCGANKLKPLVFN